MTTIASHIKEEKNSTAAEESEEKKAQKLYDGLAGQVAIGELHAKLAAQSAAASAQNLSVIRVLDEGIQGDRVAAEAAAKRAEEMFKGCAATAAHEERASFAGGIGTLVGAGAGVAAAILVGKRMGFEPSTIAPLVGGGAVVGGAAGGLSGLGVNALLEWRAKNKK